MKSARNDRTKQNPVCLSCCSLIYLMIGWQNLEGKKCASFCLCSISLFHQFGLSLFCLHESYPFILITVLRRSSFLTWAPTDVLFYQKPTRLFLRRGAFSWRVSSCSATKISPFPLSATVLFGLLKESRP